MKTKQGFSTILAIIIGLLIIGGGFYYFSQNNREVENNNEGENMEETEDILNLNVPSIIEKNRVSDTELRLSHSVPYKHTNFCDMREAKTLEVFGDYSNTIYIYEDNLPEVIGQIFPSAIIKDIIDDSGNMKLQTGYIDKLTINSKEVYRVTMGVEGCGYYTYIVPGNDQVAVIRRDFTPPFSGNFTEETVNEYKSIDGVIKPEEADAIFNSVLTQIVDKI